MYGKLQYPEQRESCRHCKRTADVLESLARNSQVGWQKGAQQPDLVDSPGDVVGGRRLCLFRRSDDLSTS
jgi:hypothetical protein